MLCRKLYSNSNYNENIQQLIPSVHLEPSWQYLDSNTNLKDGHQEKLLAVEDHHNKMSGNINGYNINVLSSWQGKEEHFDFSPCLTSSQFKQFPSSYSDEASLVITVPPENRFRYRYDTEMSGTHGSLQGARTGREKSVPTVELLNFPFEALIRVSLVTCQENNEHYPHPHSLFVKEKLYQKNVYENWDRKVLTKTGHYSDPHYIKVGVGKDGHVARFEGMCIINSKKENFHSFVKDKILRRYRETEGCQVTQDGSLTLDESEKLVKLVEAAVSSVDVDFVSLCFEAFKEEGGKLFPICPPVYSEPIGNAKSAKTGKLKISKINKCSGSCKGGDEIWLLVEKINKKGLVVKFWEQINGKTIWESCIEGNDLILHHQYAIIFKTPPYKDLNIASEVEVFMRLERTIQPNQPCDFSESITFIYEPSKIKSSKGDNLFRKESILPLKQSQTKRPRTECGAPGFNSLNKRKTDDFDVKDMNLVDPDSDLEQLLLDGRDILGSNEVWSKFNIEEFLRFISPEDEDMPMQKDGVAYNSKYSRDLFFKLYMLYSKMDESDVKKLTEQISNFKVSKQEISEVKSGTEKDQVKDAASTLLSLRSSAKINPVNNSSKSARMKGKSLRDSVSVKSEYSNSNSESCIAQPEGRFSINFTSVKSSLAKGKTLQGEEKPKRCLQEKEDKEKTVKSLVNALEEETILQPFAFKEIKKEICEDQAANRKKEEIRKILNKNVSGKNLPDVKNSISAVFK